MKERLQRFMYGRYGQDDLNKLLSIVSLASLVISMFTGWTVLYSLALVLLVFYCFRMFSRNTWKRAQENTAYLQARGRVVRWFSSRKSNVTQRKTHRFYKCPSCHTRLRVPKGRGRISIICPKCGTAFEKKT